LPARIVDFAAAGNRRSTPEMNDLFSYKPQSGSSGIILYGSHVVAEIRDLSLCNVRFRPGGRIVFGDEVPVPLYWQQYIGHQDPERRANVFCEVACVHAGEDSIHLQCSGENESRTVRSIYDIVITCKGNTYVYDVEATFSIKPGESWYVEYNRDHGELEFCNLWPQGSFTTDRSTAKLYEACFVQRGATVVRIPHHHLESSDKRNVMMAENDRFMWLLEDENPVLEMLTDHAVCAGLCAYMWDAHFAYRVTSGEEGILLSSTDAFRARFALYSIDAVTGKSLLESAWTPVVKELETVPVITLPVNRFSKCLREYDEPWFDLWPWSVEKDDATDECTHLLDRARGFDDNGSLRIDHRDRGTSRWVATALGPAFGGPPFPEGARFHLAAHILTRQLEGQVSIALRLHRPGRGSVYDVSNYEIYRSDEAVSGDVDWSRLEIMTPPISPAPDRVHIVLQLSGKGSVWFDNVEFLTGGEA